MNKCSHFKKLFVVRNHPLLCKTVHKKMLTIILKNDHNNKNMCKGHRSVSHDWKVTGTWNSSSILVWSLTSSTILYCFSKTSSNIKCHFSCLKGTDVDMKHDDGFLTNTDSLVWQWKMVFRRMVVATNWHNYDFTMGQIFYQPNCLGMLPLYLLLSTKRGVKIHSVIAQIPATDIFGCAMVHICPSYF